MDKIVEDTIFGCLPRAKKIEDGENGRCKIVLPRPVNQMEECEALRRALKESPARPTCLNCHSQNTRFRYFQNSSSSKSLQARYDCLACTQHFTFGGKMYPKRHNALTLMYPTAQKGLVSDDQGVRGKMYTKHQPNVLTIQQPNALTIQQPKM